MSANWVHVSTTSDDSKVYIDTTSIREASVKIMGDNSPLYVVGEKYEIDPSNADAKKLGMVSTKIQSYYSCQHRAFYQVSVVGYKADRSVLVSWNDNKAILTIHDLKPVVPDTVSETKLDFVCKWVGQ